MKRSYDSTGVPLDSGFAPVPEGIYSLIIREVADTKDGMPWKTKNGDDYVRVTCEIDDKSVYLGRKVWYGVTFIDDKTRPGAGMAINFLKNIGEPWEGAFEIDTDRWIGKTFKVKLKITRDNKNNLRNDVAYIVSEEQAEDEIPF